MNIKSADEALDEILKYGKTSNKKYRKLPSRVIKDFVKTANILSSANRIEDIYASKGLNYEVLRGNRKGQESVRCNRTWRLIFKSFPQEGSIIITEILLLELSHHYE